jgi:hypothetical protein
MDPGSKAYREDDIKESNSPQLEKLQILRDAKRANSPANMILSSRILRGFWSRKFPDGSFPPPFHMLK